MNSSVEENVFLIMKTFYYALLSSRQWNEKRNLFSLPIICLEQVDGWLLRTAHTNSFVLRTQHFVHRAVVMHVAERFSSQTFLCKSLSWFMKQIDKPATEELSDESCSRTVSCHWLNRFVYMEIEPFTVRNWHCLQFLFTRFLWEFMVADLSC